MIVMIEKIDYKPDEGNLLECRICRNGVDSNYRKTKFAVFEKKSTKHSLLLVTMKFPPVIIANT